MEKSKKFILKSLAVFYRDFQWKLLSLGLAFILWVVGVNVTNPIQIISYDRLPLTVLHRDHLTHNNIVFLNEQQVNNTLVNVTVSATRNDHESINAARNQNIQASINLSTINTEHIHAAEEAITVPIDVNVFIHQDHTGWTMSPASVNLTLDRYGESSRPIEVDLIGTPMEGFEARPHQLDRTMVRLSGARSILDQVSSVWVRVYVNESYETVEEVVNLIVYNREGANITNDVTLSFQTAHVRVPIYPYESIPLDAAPAGIPFAGFQATAVEIEPPSVYVVGDSYELEELSSIFLGEVDITLANQDVYRTFDISQALIGTGLTLREGSPTEAEVRIVVERVIERGFELPLENLEVINYARPYTIITEGPVPFRVRGRESLVNPMTLNNVQASVDLAGLGAGIHVVPVNFSLPHAVNLSNTVTIEISIEPEPIAFEPEEPQDEWTDNSPQGEGLNPGLSGNQEDDSDHLTEEPQGSTS